VETVPAVIRRRQLGWMRACRKNNRPFPVAASPSRTFDNRRSCQLGPYPAHTGGWPARLSGCHPSRRRCLRSEARRCDRRSRIVRSAPSGGRHFRPSKYCPCCRSLSPQDVRRALRRPGRFHCPRGCRRLVPSGSARSGYRRTSPRSPGSKCSPATVAFQPPPRPRPAVPAHDCIPRRAPGTGHSPPPIPRWARTPDCAEFPH
jgi:hypothetical protein